MKGIANKSVIDNSVYTAPRCLVLGVFPEGVLCISTFYSGGYHSGIEGDDESII